ncbi:MAG TPA: LysM peptidoglycan-binding domain-containing protein [Galbitalea sp.]
MSPFVGLVPSRLRAAEHGDVDPVLRAPSRSTRHVLNTVPIVLVGSLALATLNLTGALDVGAAQARRTPRPDSNTSDLSRSVGAALAAARSTSGATVSTGTSAVDSTISTAAVAAPAHYTVRHGDTVSEIAGRYGLSTASVLALNGLSWKSVIFPGQVLKLTKTGATAPIKAATPPAKSAPVTSTGSASYTIKSGDTVTSIAKHFGVSVQAILTANHLTATSIIYAGRKLVIPGKRAALPPVSSPVVTTPPATSAPGTAPAQVGGTVTPLSPEMKANATVVIQVGRRLGVPDYGIIVALAAAAQESGLRNLAYGDLDSVGLFQQRPSTGWGTVAQLENTTHASELFYGGPSNPNKGKTRGLLDIKGWQSMTLTQAAQAVQVSAQPNAYAKWETSARAWFAQLG